jgi:NADPH-dependent 2,4-dienoyl-CoA reductase/sulfur reductase-like enzyme
MRTSDPQIWAVGDVVEVPDVVTGQDTVLPLAGPANRQGRVAAESVAGRATQFRGIQATAVVGVLGLTVASTGASEKGLRRAGVTSFAKVYLHPGHHAGYYPGARPIHLKLLFSMPDGRILGAQAIGLEGVEKRIDVIATAIQLRGTVHDLAEAELCYAPQFGAAKDPVNSPGCWPKTC